MNVYEAKTLEVQSAETSAKTSATTRGSSMTNHDRSILKHNPAYFTIEINHASYCSQYIQ